jgi:hypothetical protein
VVRLEYAIVVAVADRYYRLRRRPPAPLLGDVRAVANGADPSPERGWNVAAYASNAWWWIGVAALAVAFPLGIVIRAVVGQQVVPNRYYFPVWVLISVGAIAFCQFGVIVILTRLGRPVGRGRFWTGLVFAVVVSAAPFYNAVFT